MAAYHGIWAWTKVIISWGRWRMASTTEPWRGADAWKARVGGRALRHVLDVAWLRASNWRAGRRSSREDMVVRCSICLSLLLELELELELELVAS